MVDQKNWREPAPPAAPTAAPDTAAGELLTIARVAREIGVPADHVERLQSTMCLAGEDFVDVDGAAVFTPAGAEKIRARVAEEMGRDVPAIRPAAASPGAALAPRRADLRLTRVFRWSRNILAELPNGNEVVLSVRSNQHLKAGMVLKDCSAGEFGWSYDGRLPRTIGEEQLYFPVKPPGKTKGKK